jgi:hypothetical protein
MRSLQRPRRESQLSRRSDCMRKAQRAGRQARIEDGTPVKETARTRAAEDDPVPYNAVRLTEAYEVVLANAEKDPALEFEIDDDWKKILNASREFERSIQDPDVFDRELEEYWHLSKIVNLFLRSQLEEGRLLACVRDPETGQILRTSSGGWLPSSWDKHGYVPSGIWTDFIDPDFYDAPGPGDAFVRGRQRPIFFLYEDYEPWFVNIFGSRPGFSWKIGQASDRVDRAPIPSIGPWNKDHRRIAAKQAIVRVFGPDGPPAGLQERDRNDKINNYLRELGIKKVAEATIRRALREMRSHPIVDDRS